MKLLDQVHEACLTKHYSPLESSGDTQYSSQRLQEPVSFYVPGIPPPRHRRCSDNIPLDRQRAFRDVPDFLAKLHCPIHIEERISVDLKGESALTLHIVKSPTGKLCPQHEVEGTVDHICKIFA